MKKLLLTLLFFISFFICAQQDTIPPDNSPGLHLESELADTVDARGYPIPDTVDARGYPLPDTVIVEEEEITGEVRSFRLYPVGDKTVTAGSELSFTIKAEGEGLSFAIYELAGGTVDNRGNFRWRAPANAINNQTFNARIVVQDKFNNIAEDRIRIIISAEQNPPIWQTTFIDGFEIYENQEISFTLYATDREGGEIIYLSDNLPPQATLNRNSGVFRWTPTNILMSNERSRDFFIRFTAVDNTGLRSEELTVKIKVNAILNIMAKYKSVIATSTDYRSSVTQLLEKNQSSLSGVQTRNLIFDILNVVVSAAGTAFQFLHNNEQTKLTAGIASGIYLTASNTLRLSLGREDEIAQRTAFLRVKRNEIDALITDFKNYWGDEIQPNLYADPNFQADLDYLNNELQKIKRDLERTPVE
jgi:hypothetical protein